MNGDDASWFLGGADWCLLVISFNSNYHISIIVCSWTLFWSLILIFNFCQNNLIFFSVLTRNFQLSPGFSLSNCYLRAIEKCFSISIEAISSALWKILKFISGILVLTYQLITLIINCSFDFSWSSNLSFLAFCCIKANLYSVAVLWRFKIQIIFQMILNIYSSLPNTGIKLLLFTYRCWLYNRLLNRIRVFYNILVTKS